MRRAYANLSRRDRALDAAAMADRAKQLGPLLDAADDTWPPGTWVTSETGFTRVGPDGKSDAHVTRLDYRTWGIGTHWAPCVVWVRCADFKDFAFADEVLAAT